MRTIRSSRNSCAQAEFYALEDMVAGIAQTRKRFSMLRTLDVIASSVGGS